MAITEVKAAIQRFIENDQSDLVIFRGPWGVGKTYLWNSLLDEASNGEKVGRKRYAYVSLFGVNTVEELKTAIFVALRELSGEKRRSWQPDLGQIRKQLPNFEQIPKLKDYTGGLLTTALVSLTLKDALVCFDDLERKGKQLQIADFLGLASFLKEQRNCKIAIILNEDALDQQELDDFRTHGEKLVDIELTFPGSTEYAFNCVFSTDYPFYKALNDACASLQITNIRILQRLKRMVDSVSSVLQETCDESVLRSVLRTMGVMVWSYYDKSEGVPRFDYVKQLRFDPLEGMVQNASRDEEKEEKLKWKGILNSFGYNSTDEVGKAIANYIESGYLDVTSFRALLVRRNDQGKTEDRVKRYRDTWKLYSESFDDNEEEFIRQLIASFEAAMADLDLMDLHSPVVVLRSLGCDELANDLISRYFDFHTSRMQHRYLATYEELASRPDPVLLQRLTRAIAETPIPVEFEDVLQQVADAFLDPEREQVLLEALAHRSDDEYSAYLMSLRGERLHPTIRSLLQIGGTVNASTREQTIHRKTVQALTRIGQQSRLNRIRVRKWFGLTVPDEDAPKEISALSAEPAGESEKDTNA